MIKNAADQVLTVGLRTTTGAAYTGAIGTITVYITIDGGTQASGTGTLQNEGNGQYSYFPTQAETNGDAIGFLFTASGVIPEPVMVYTTTGVPTFVPASVSASTTIEAIRQMMRGIGETRPDDTEITTPVRDDILMAIDILTDCVRDLCQEGWHWNTDDCFEIAPTGSPLKVDVPSDALSIDPVDSYVDYVERDDSGTRRMYDRDNYTFNITDTVDYRIVRLVSFEQMPQAARSYVAHMATQKFIKQALGDTAQVELNVEDVQRARIQLERDELESNDTTPLRAPEMWRIARRGRNLGYL